MQEKYKELLTDVGLTTLGTGTEIAWTGFLVWATSKIPYIGIPVATILGITGVTCAAWLASGSRMCYYDWKKKYSSSL